MTQTSANMKVRYSQQAYDALKEIDKGNLTVLHYSQKKEKDVRRIRLMARGRFEVKRVPMMQFPDPHIPIEYQLITIGHLDDNINHCQHEKFQGDRERGVCICSCVRDDRRFDDDREYRAEVIEGQYDLLRTCLLLAVHRVPECGSASSRRRRTRSRSERLRT